MFWIGLRNKRCKSGFPLDENGRHFFFIDYLQKGKHYANLLQRLYDVIKRAECCYIITMHQFTHAYRCGQNQWGKVWIASHSPDLFPLDYFIFFILKKWLHGRKFPNYKQGIESIEHRNEFNNLTKQKYTKKKSVYITPQIAQQNQNKSTKEFLPTKCLWAFL